MTYTVKLVAKMSGVSIRALHHYDAIGLLKPSSLSASGYRQYRDEDLERLQEVLFFRELGFSLEDIRKIIDSPEYDRRQALTLHRDLLLEKRKKMDELVRTIGRTLDSMERGTKMESTGLFGGLDEATMEEYRQEARARWGSVVDESYRKYGQYSKAEKDAMAAEISSVYTKIAGLMDGDPALPEVQALVGRWHQIINERFYECSVEVFRNLGDMYVQDARFTANIDKTKPGLAKYMRDAMHVYADRKGKVA